jgi:hypothetical protein
MARSTRNDAQRLSALKLEAALADDLEELAGSEDGLIGASGGAVEILNLGHAGLRNDCWSGANARGLGSFRSEFAAPQFAAPRFRGPGRRRTRLHHMRPPYKAETRFTSDHYEFLTC